MSFPSLPSKTSSARDGLFNSADDSEATAEFAIDGNLPSTQINNEIGENNVQHVLTDAVKHCPTMNGSMPTAEEAMVGAISPGSVSRLQGNERSHTSTEPSPAARNPSPSPPPLDSGRTNQESCTGLPDPLSEMEPVAADSRFIILHHMMKKAMVEAATMLQGHMPIKAGRYLDTEEKYDAALDILPYCPQAECGVGDPFAMSYFGTYRDLNDHLQQSHPEVNITYHPPKEPYHAMLRLLGFLEGSVVKDWKEH